MVYRTPTKVTQIKSNWNSLWERLRDLYYIAEKPRYAAVLENFRNSKEHICRKMGVVSHADIARVAAKLAPKNN